MLKKIAALLTRKPFPAPKEEVVEVVSLSEKPKKPTVKKATTRDTKKVIAKVTKSVAKKVAAKKTVKKKYVV